MYRWCGQVLVVAVATVQLIAQREDSVRVVFRPVLVEDSLGAPVVAAIPRVELPRARLDQLPATTVADAAQGLPGVFVRNYGGLGGLKTISIRGATAAQTAVVLDGIRLNSIANGLVDLGQIPLALLENLTIERGSQSARWGAHAVGGTVLLSLRQQSSGVIASGALGAFGERRGTLQATIHPGNHTITALADVQYSQGNYPFRIDEFGVRRRLERTNGDALLASGALLWHIAGMAQSGSVAVIARSSQRGAPGAVLQGAIENTAARLNEREVLTISSMQFGQESSWTLRAAVRWFQQHYRDSLARFRGPSGADDQFTAYDGALVLEMSRIDGNNWYVAPAAELYANTLRGNLYRSGAGSVVRRVQLGVAAQAGATLHTTTAYVLGLGAALRADAYSDVPSALSGSVDLRWISASVPLALRLSVGTSYRPPSFNELYYQNFGSTSIRPERGVTVSGGAVATLGACSLQADAFVLWVRDQIIAVPRSALTWSVQNAGRVLSRGVELLAAYADGGWNLNLSGTYQQVTYDDPTTFTYGKQVIYTPSLLGMVRAERVFWRGIAALVQATYLGTRYSQTDNAPSSALEAVLTVDASLRALLLEWPVEVELRGELLNLFDATYAIISNYPMPGRSWRIRLLARWR